ncbi:hypothetical protein [Xylophilus sp. ASV27]|uniref:hypothetical protein n=1 Tax=Xylophilus sp. ASV27 TaxID=2795129 RepID=UPI0018EC4F27|nr:hypothetical protein [Xylophilus sp. ASV27]
MHENRLDTFSASPLKLSSASAEQALVRCQDAALDILNPVLPPFDGAMWEQ